MRNLFLGVVLFSQLIFSGAFAVETATHPVPKEPKFLSKDIYKDLKSTLGAAPALNSPQQKEDEVVLRNYQQVRSVEDCKRAQAEVYVSLESFFGPQSKVLTKEEVAQYSSFFEQVRNDADYFIQQLKVDFPRERPFRYLTDLNPCVAREITGAYPSGHAVLAKLYALILSEYFPERKFQLEERALQIAQGRVLSGMHHPTDITAGRSIAEHLFKSLMRSKDFQVAMDLANVTGLAR